MRCQVPHQESQSVNISKPRKKTPEDSSRLVSFFSIGARTFLGNETTEQQDQFGNRPNSGNCMETKNTGFYTISAKTVGDDSSGFGQGVGKRGARDGTLHGLPCNQASQNLGSSA